MRVALYIISLSCVLAVSSCSSGKKDNASEEHSEVSVVKLSPQQVTAAGITTVKAEKKLMEQEVECNGQVDVPPQNLLTVAPMMSGFVKELKVVPSQAVRKGQVLAVLQHTEYIHLQQQYLEAVSKLTFLEKESERQQSLREENATSTKNLEQSRSEYESLRASASGLAAQLRLIGIDPVTLKAENISSTIQIVSPGNGYISELFCNPGMFVESRQPMFEIVDKSYMHIELQVFERDIYKVAPGQKILFRTNEQGSPQMEASVHLINEKVNANTKTVMVHGDIDSKYSFIKTKSYVNATILAHPAEVTAVPDACISTDGKESFVFLLQKPGEYLQLPVKTGHKGAGYTEILNPDTRLLTLPIVNKGVNRLFNALNGGDEGGHAH